MNFDRIQAAEVKLWDFSAYFLNTPRKRNVTPTRFGICGLFFVVEKNVRIFRNTSFYLMKMVKMGKTSVMS